MSASACSAAGASVLVTVNSGYTDMFCSWLLHYRQLQLPYPVYALAFGQAGVSAATGQLGSGRVLQNAKLDDLHLERSSNFGTPTFMRIIHAKIAALDELIQRTGRPVVYSDIDTVWLQDVVAHVLDASGQPPRRGLGILQEHGWTRKEPLHLCACVTVACADGQARGMLGRWRAAFNSSFVDHHGRASVELEQDVLAALLRREQQFDGGADVWLLPTARLPAGHEVKQRRQIDARAHLWVHANYVHGKAAKVRRLQQLGLWKPEACGSGVRGGGGGGLAAGSASDRRGARSRARRPD